MEETTVDPGAELIEQARIRREKLKKLTDEEYEKYVRSLMEK